MKQQAPITLNLKTIGFVNFYFPSQLEVVAEEKLQKLQGEDDTIDSSYLVGYLSAVIDKKRYFAIVGDKEGITSTLADAAAMGWWNEENDEQESNIEAVYHNTPKIPAHIFDAIAVGARLDTKKATAGARHVLVDGITLSQAVKITGLQHNQTTNAIERVLEIYWSLSPLLK